MKSSNYISDGGLRKKLDKYNRGLAFNSPHISFPKTSKNKAIEIQENKNKNHNLFLWENNIGKGEYIKKQKIEKIKLLSKTVRESNKRPIFPKKEKHKNSSKNTFWKKIIM